MFEASFFKDVCSDSLYIASLKLHFQGCLQWILLFCIFEASLFNDVCSEPLYFARLKLHFLRMSAMTPSMLHRWSFIFKDVCSESFYFASLKPGLTRRYNGQKSLARSRQLALRWSPMREAVRSLLEQQSRKTSRQRNERRRLGIKQKVAKWL